MNNKIIFTIDFDAFFASCEEKKNPTLKNHPIVVGRGIGSNINRGVVTTCNYNARKYGIHSAMPLYKVEQIQREIEEKIILIDPDFPYYSKLSNQIFGIIKTFSKKIQISSIDECYLDVSEILITTNQTPIELAKQIQQTVLNKTNITTSIGISSNILLSKIASKINKPFGIYEIYPNEISTKLWNLSIEELYGLGKASVPILKEKGFETIGDLAKLKNNLLELNDLSLTLGKKIYDWIALANGISSNQVDTSYYELKSISHGETYSQPLSIEELELKIKDYAALISQKMKYRNIVGKTVFIKIKQKNTQKGKNKKLFNRQAPMKEYSNEASKIYNAAFNLLDEFENIDVIHLSLGVAQLKNNYFELKQKKFSQFTSLEDNKPIDKTLMEMKDVIFQVNTHFNQKLLIDLNEMKNTKRFQKDDLLQDDRVKFKVWSEND